MSLENNIIINIYSICLLIIIYLHSLKIDEKKSIHHRLFIAVLLTTILMLILDIFSRLDGNTLSFYPILNNLGNFLMFLLNPVLPSLWLLYVHIQVVQDEEKTRRIVYPLAGVFAVNLVLLILTQFYGWYYYIDSNNTYHRGSLFWLPVAITLSLIIVVVVLILMNRKRVERNYFFTLLFFAFPPFVCVILQIVFYGISIILNSVVLSVLIVFLNIQNRSVFTDYLTGVNNRKRLEMYLREKINASSENKTFSSILIDLDNFKSINDTFGHDMGDSALKASTKVLGSCLGSKDFISRYGGDEFFIVLETFDKAELEDIIGRINRSVKRYNESGPQPYTLGFSMGYGVYDYHSNMSAEEFEKHIDILMYENKRINKKLVI